MSPQKVTSTNNVQGLSTSARDQYAPWQIIGIWLAGGVDPQAPEPSLRRSPEIRSRGARLAFGLMLGISLINLLIVFGMAAGLTSLTNELLDPPLIIRIVLGLSILSALLTPTTLIACVLVWKDGYWGAAFRAYYTLLTCSALAFVWFMYFYNMLGWRY